jgi:hypothetical protein
MNKLQDDDDIISNRLFVASKEVEIVDDKECEYYQLHSVNLETGLVAPLSYRFQSEITQICQNPEGVLNLSKISKVSFRWQFVCQNGPAS